MQNKHFAETQFTNINFQKMSEFTGNIAGTVAPGQVFLITGKTIEDANRFNINFRNSKYEDSVIVFHISVRFDENIIVRNTKFHHGWGVEEREQNLGEFSILNPLVPGEQFKFYIFLGDTKFHLAINDYSFCTYPYQIPLDLIRTIEVVQDVEYVTRIDHRSVYPTLWPKIQMDNQTVAFSNDIPVKFRPGHVIVITAIPTGNHRGSFILSFSEDGTAKQALHFNPRFDPLYVVVRNAMNNYMKFGNEERNGDFPFSLDTPFKLAIAFTPFEFRFAVNGEFFESFSYRSESILEKLNGFKINTGNGMHMHVTGVDHIYMGVEYCEGFEGYSSFDMVLY